MSFSSSDSAGSSDSVIIEAGSDGPIDNFFFRQCPAEFKLKISGPEMDFGTVPKTSLLQISHSKGIVLFPHSSKGCLGYAPIHMLAERESLKEELLAFPGDESSISSICLDPSESFAFVAKTSNKLYSIDLAVDAGNKRPFISKIVQLDFKVLEIVSTKDFGLWVLLENGKIKNFTCQQLKEERKELLIKDPISCISQINGNVMALGAKNSSTIHLVYFDNEVVEYEEIEVPFEDLECGSIGISSIVLLQDGNSLLFSCKPDNPESDDVPLILLENILSTEEGLKFSFYFDPCASRPPRENQFYYLSTGKWSDNLVDFVVLGNYASPDIGICGRLASNELFETFFIDDDEGLAQLPFINGEVTFPIGMALDFSSKTPLENLIDIDAENYPPAPILWVLTNSGHLCPFSMLKTDLTEPLSFMKAVPIVSFEESLDVSVPSVSVITALHAVTAPQTPSKVPLQQLASLQKSNEITPSFKPAPVAVIPEKPTVKPVITTFVPEPEPEKLVKKEEKMESLSVGPYQNILLTEIAATHAAMQEDIFTLKQLALKNSLLLRQNSQKYFNSLESLEKYAGSLEKLLKSSENVFSSVKDKVDVLKFSLNELMGKSQQVKSIWNRIKLDRKINWDARLRTLTTISEELFQRIDRLRNFLSNPLEAAKYRATLKSFVDSAQESVQHLMAQLSGLFVVSQNEETSEFYADLEALDLNSGMASCDNLLSQLNILSLSGSGSGSSFNLKSELRYKSLLNATKSRGSRLLIPSRITPSAASSTTEKALKLSAEDEFIISSFVSAIKLTEEVPEFAEIAILAKMTLDESVPEAKTAVADSKSTEPAKATSAFSFNSPSVVATGSSKPVSSFSFNAPSAPKATDSPKPASSFSFNAPIAAVVPKPVTESSPKPAPVEPAKSSIFSFTPPSAPKPLTESSPKPASPFSFSVPISTTEPEPKPMEAKAAEVTPKPAETKPTESKPAETKPAAESTSSLFSFAPTAASNEPKVSSFGFKISPESNPNVPESPAQTTKIPSIFTFKPSDNATKEASTFPVEPPVSVMKKESPLPTFESLDFGSSAASSTTEAKPFPSIFGVKTETESELEKKSETEDKAKVDEVVVKKDTEVVFKEATSSFAGFSFSKQQPSTESVPSPVISISKPAAQSPPPPQQSLFATTPQSQSPPFSFSFAPNSNNPAAASITTKPKFPNSVTPLPPVFGATSIPIAPSVSLAPAFGQTSLPAGSGFSAFSSNNTGGFAVFASTTATSANNSANFSAFASDNSSSAGTLTFASFLPTPTDKKAQDQNPPANPNSSTKPSSTFSFTGFRE